MAADRDVEGMESEGEITAQRRVCREGGGQTVVLMIQMLL